MSSDLRRFLRRPWLVQLLLASLLLQALIPVGFMPGVASDGTPTLKLCSAYNPMVAPRGAANAADHLGNAGSHGDHADFADHGVCPFAAAATVAIPAGQVLQVAVAFEATRVVLPVVVVAFSNPAPRFRLPRGPPVQV